MHLYSHCGLSSNKSYIYNKILVNYSHKVVYFRPSAVVGGVVVVVVVALHAN